MNGAKLKNWLSSTTSSSSSSKDRRKSLRGILSTVDSGKRKTLKPKLDSTRLELEELEPSQSSSPSSETVVKKPSPANILSRASVVQRPVLKEGNWTGGNAEKSTIQEGDASRDILSLEEATRSLAVSSVQGNVPIESPKIETEPSLAQPDAESVLFGTATARGVLAPATRFPSTFGKNKDPAWRSETDNDWRSGLGSELEEEERMDFDNSIAFKDQRTYSALPETGNPDLSVVESYDFHGTETDGERRLTFPPFRVATPEPGLRQSSEPWAGRGARKNVHDSNDDEFEQLLSSTSRLYPLNDLEASYVETYKQDVSEIVELRGKVERLQQQVKQVRKYMKELARAEMQKYIPAAIVIQSHWRGYVVRRRLASLGIFPLQTFTLKRPEDERLYSLSALRQDCSGIGLAGTSAWSDDMRLSRSEQHRAVVLLQALMRGRIVRRRVGEFLEDLGMAHRASTMIQAVWRGHRCRKQYSSMFHITKTLRRIHLTKIDGLMVNMARMADQLAIEREERKRQDEVLRHLLDEVTKLREQMVSNNGTADSKKTERGKSEQTTTNAVYNPDGESIIDGDRFAAQLPAKIDLLSRPELVPQRTNPRLSPIIRSEPKFDDETATTSTEPPESVVRPIPTPPNQIQAGTVTSSQRSSGFDTSRFVGIDDYEYLKAEVDCLRLNYESLQLAIFGVPQDGDDDDEDLDDGDADRTLLHD